MRLYCMAGLLRLVCTCAQRGSSPLSLCEEWQLGSLCRLMTEKEAVALERKLCQPACMSPGVLLLSS